MGIWDNGTETVQPKHDALTSNAERDDPRGASAGCGEGDM
jgi:hypothetical protein